MGLDIRVYTGLEYSQYTEEEDGKPGVFLSSTDSNSDGLQTGFYEANCETSFHAGSNRS